MGFCPGPDEPFVCIGCSGYSADPDASYIGMSYVEADYGCQVGCKACKQSGLFKDWMRPEGPRWLKAYMPLNQLVDDTMLPNRMANGMVGDLRSMELLNSESEVSFWNTRRVPESIYYNRGVCWDNLLKREGFGKDDAGADACECDVVPNTGADENGVCSDSRPGSTPTPMNSPLSGVMPDLFFYENINIVHSSALWCRQRPEHDSKLVIITNGELFTPTILRTNRCGGNLFHFCTQRWDCSGPCFECGERPPDEPEPWLSDQHNAFGFVPIQFNDVRLRSGLDNHSFPFGDGAVKDFKNAVLAQLPNIAGASGEGTFVFGQLDRWSDPGNSTIWSRGFAADDVSIFGVQRGIVPFAFGNCRLQHSTYHDIDPDSKKRHPVPVVIHPYIVEADIKMWLIAQQVITIPEGVPVLLDPFEESKRIYPQVRMQIKVRMSYYVEFAEPSPDAFSATPQIFENWWPEDHPNYERGTSTFLTNGFDDRFPSEVDKPLRYPPLVSPVHDTSGSTYDDALAASRDRILIFNNHGRQFDIPDVVEWWGYLGVYGGSKNAYIFDPSDYQFNGLPDCCRLLGYLDGLKVQGWPYNFGSYDESVGGLLNAGDMEQDDWKGRGLYGGSVQLNFTQNLNYAGLCGPPA